MAALVARRQYDGRLRHLRDERYFDWRFRDPRSEYRFLFVGGDTLEGYLVVKHTNCFADARARVEIVDVEADEPRIRSALLEAAIHAGGFSEVVIWRASLDAGFRDDLTRFGFKPIDSPVVHGGPQILVRPIDDARLQQEWRINGVRLLDLGNWDMRMIYSMAG
jgi:hypothetical protein